VAYSMCRVGASRRGCWRAAARNRARRRTSGCWRSLARGCAPGPPPLGGPSNKRPSDEHSSCARGCCGSAHPSVISRRCCARSAWSAVGRAPAMSAVPWLPPRSGNLELTPRCGPLHRRRIVTQSCAPIEGAPGMRALRPDPDARAASAAEPVPQDGLAGRAAIPAGGLAALREQRRRAHHARARPLA